jgi:predicted nucleic acid-binding Zn ribbon protein
MKRPAPLADLLAATFAGKPAQARMREMKIWEVWAGAVGGQIASRAIPASFRDGVLTVRVSGSSWMQQLSLMKGEIVSQVNDALGEQLVREIFFKQGSIAAEAAPQPFIPPSRQLSAAELAWIREQGAGIDDPELRRTLESLLTRHLQSLPPSDSP